MTRFVHKCGYRTAVWSIHFSMTGVSLTKILSTMITRTITMSKFYISLHALEPIIICISVWQYYCIMNRLHLIAKICLCFGIEFFLFKQAYPIIIEIKESVFIISTNFWDSLVIQKLQDFSAYHITGCII